jgi:cobalamin biosynthesis protein CobT
MGRHMARGGAQDYNNTLEATAGLTNIMRRKLERALMAKQQRDWDYGREHGRLDSRRLASAYAAKPNVFKMRDDRLEMDTALSMLIDLSGSMSGHKVHLAMQAVIAMCEAIDRTGIQYEVLGFNNRSGWIDSVPRPQRTEGRMYSRFDPLDMYVFKDFQERLNEAKGALSTITHMSGGDNGDSEAVQHAFDRLRKRSEKRKVLMVFSDGRPRTSGDFGFHHLQEHLRSVIADIEAADVDVMGIGICDNAVSQFYPKFVVVDSVEDLAGSALDIMARTLMGERFVVDNSKLHASA